MRRKYIMLMVILMLAALIECVSIRIQSPDEPLIDFHDGVKIEKDSIE